MANDLVQSSEQPLKPYFEKERPNCPFYGFNGMMGMMLDSKGNQCALITDSYSPCQFELKGEKPNWEKCPANTEEFRKSMEKVLDSRQVFPKELSPPKAKSWEGITLRQWIQYLNSKKE